MSPRIIRKIESRRGILFKNPPPFVHPTVNELVEPPVEILVSHGRERSDKHTGVLVSRLPRDLLTFC